MESILLHYGTVLQPFTGVITFATIFTKWFQFVLLHHIAATATVVVLYRPHSLATCPQLVVRPQICEYHYKGHDPRQR